MAGRLADQLAPSGTEAHQGMHEDMPEDEQQSLAHANGAHNGKGPDAETTAQRQGATEGSPSMNHRQPGPAARKKVG